MLASRTVICCMLHSRVYAEVGTLTAKYQEMIKSAGNVFIKCEAYSLYDINYDNKKKKKMKPSLMKEVAINSNDIYCYEKVKNKYCTGFTDFVTIAKGNKVYVLNFDKKIGEFYNLQLHGQTGAIALTGGNNFIPDALVYILPDDLRNSQMKGLPLMYKYKQAYDVAINNVVYRCEEYSNADNNPDGDNKKKKVFNMSSFVNLNRTYRLYFLDGVLVKYAHGDRVADVIEVSTTFDKSIFEIPKGFKIVARGQKNKDVNKGMDDLLQKNNGSTIEQY